MLYEVITRSGRRERARVDAVRDRHRLGGVALPVVGADDLGVRHQHVGKERRQALGQRIDRAAERPPLGASLLDPVDVA